MFELMLLAGVAFTPLQGSETINQFCSEVVGIPYASDNFTDGEWERFTYCRESIKVPQK